MKQNKHILSIILTCIALGCLIAAGIIFFKYLKEDIQSEVYSGEYQPVYPEPVIIASSDLPSQPDEPSSEDISPETETLPTEEPETEAPETTEPSAEPEPVLVPNPYAAKYLENSDMAGWLVIPDTVINYPIMWTPENEEFYLRKGFDKKKLNAGCLILDTDSCVDPLTTNLIIHGHNMKAGTMFAGITAYTDAAYRETHPFIEFETEQGCICYTIFAVIRLRKTDRWYSFLRTEDEDSFCRAIADIRSRALYDTGITPCPGQQMLTLSTCYGSHDDDRLVVIGVDLNS